MGLVVPNVLWMGLLTPPGIPFDLKVIGICLFRLDEGRHYVSRFLLGSAGPRYSHVKRSFLVR